MRKKKVWIAGCTVFLLLIICTVLSLRIEKMMRIEVETVRAVQCEEEGMTDMSKFRYLVINRKRMDLLFYFCRRAGRTVWKRVGRSEGGK